MQNTLPKDLRRILETVVVKARDVAESAARTELDRLSVSDKSPAEYLSDEQRKFRNRLRAHGRQLGDQRKPDGEQAIGRLVTEVAYEHWHRMLFARFLAENTLLIYEDGVTPLSIQDCFDLAEEETGDRTQGWQYAALYAAKMLPQIFRVDSPVFELILAPNDQKELEQLLTSLDLETFTASDALGWVYQFWQSKRKNEVNAAEVKIGADELPAVTQLFTEPYMVSFLLDNSLGAWWAARNLSEADLKSASSEEELRCKAAIPGMPLDYLRFVQQDNGTWIPAAGTFDTWPDVLSELKTLDPCCGSGHFLVAVFLMLVPMRMELEGLSPREAVDAVLRENIHGLELDQRCVELAAFALALTAWKYPGADGYRLLPGLNLACSGLAISAKKEEWMALAGDDTNLRLVLEELYKQFKDAPVLGSLINPETSLGKESLFELKWEEVGPLLTKALAGENDDEKSEMGVVAKGIAKAATILMNRFDLLTTNPPYLGERKQDKILRDFSRKAFHEGRSDLAMTFLLRGEKFVKKGSQCLVVPQNWLYQRSYESLRLKLLSEQRIRLINQLGGNAFATQIGADVLLIILSTGNDVFSGIDSTSYISPEEKSKNSLTCRPYKLQAKKLEEHSDARITLQDRDLECELLEINASCYAGILNGDTPRFICKFWEVTKFIDKWSFLQSTLKDTSFFGGQSGVILWENGSGQLRTLAIELKERLHDADRRGNQAWNKKGITISQMGELPTSFYQGDFFDSNVAVIIPKSDSLVLPIWTYCSSETFNVEVRKIDKKKNVTNATLVKVPFDLDHWTKIAEEKYPNGLPKPYSNDPSQWIFHGHPCGSVVWDGEAKWTAQAPLRSDDTVLQVAVARLLGYRWPAELDVNMKLADEQREWVNRCESLLSHVDDDGIVCIPAVRGEQPADQRLETLLQAAYGHQWSISVRNKILESAGCKNKSVDFWLREKFFAQHCKLFQNRPFIWHVWDGLKDGFAALVNYHQLDRKNLERLLYNYLHDWIRTQKHDQSEGVDGAGVRLAAAEGLKRRLEQILEGEAPYDIFVRWKPLDQQPIGWEPDLNDGVRMNVRPFMTVEDIGKKGAGILRSKPNIHWKKDRGKDVASAPWYSLGLEYGEGEGVRINDHHLSMVEKQTAGDG